MKILDGISRSRIFWNIEWCKNDVATVVLDIEQFLRKKNILILLPEWKMFQEEQLFHN